MVDPASIQRMPGPVPGLPQTAAKRAEAPQPETDQQQPPSAVQLRKQSNAAILRANQQVSLQSGNEPLALVYSAAIDAINIELEAELGENALQRGLEQGLDISPEATAERIVQLTTALFSRFQQHNSELDFDQQVERFVEVIGSGIERGFNEAREILDGLKVLEGEIGELVDQTYQQVQLQLNDYKERMLGGDQASEQIPE